MRQYQLDQNWRRIARFTALSRPFSSNTQTRSIRHEILETGIREITRMCIEYFRSGRTKKTGNSSRLCSGVRFSIFLVLDVALRGCAGAMRSRIKRLDFLPRWSEPRWTEARSFPKFHRLSWFRGSKIPRVCALAPKPCGLALRVAITKCST